MRRKILVRSELKLALSIGAISCLMVQADCSWQDGPAIGMIFALSSRAIVLQKMTKKDLRRTT